MSGVLRTLLRSPGAIWRVWVPALVLSVLLAGITGQVMRAEGSGKRDLRERFALRTALAGDFTEAFVTEIRARERAQARRWLAGPDVSTRTFGQVSGGFGFDVAVLLDSAGRVLAVSPPKASLLGTKIASKYPHLRAAIRGHAALSPVVLSAAEHKPVVASAVPFPTASGRRVFSGGFLVEKTPLGAYLQTTSSIAGSGFAILDSSGALVVRSTTPMSDGANDALLHRVDRDGYYVVRRPIAGTPWTIVSVVPTKALYAPIGHRFILSWVILAALAVASLTALVLLYRLMSRHEELLGLSTSDPLTGLWNRRALEESYSQRLVHSARYTHREGALLLLDVDNFKQVNDRLGHATGDRLLVQIAATLRETLRESDLIARLGGDEFAILLPHATPESASLVVGKIEQAVGNIGVSDPIFADFEIRASVGFAIEDDTITSLDALLSAADDAMYAVKETRTQSSHNPRTAPRSANGRATVTATPARPHP